VIADIPGFIEGASEGLGLGIQFLKHLERTKLLLHIVDVAPLDNSNPADDARKLVQELRKYSTKLVEKERWLLLNKLDLLPEDEQQARCEEIIKNLDWQGPVYQITAIAKRGTRVVCEKIMEKIELAAEQDAECDNEQ